MEKVNKKNALFSFHPMPMHTHNANVFVNRIDAGAGILVVQRAPDDFLYGQHDAILAAQPDHCAALFDGLVGVVDLKDTAVR